MTQTLFKEVIETHFKRQANAS